MKNPKINRNYQLLAIATALTVIVSACKTPGNKSETPAAPIAHSRMPVILDTDANNELDDQHAMAYLFYNQDTFDIKGITVNTTMGGGNIDAQYAEAERIMKLCAIDSIPLLKGADKSFAAIEPTIASPDFDGHDAVDFIIRSANENTNGKLVLIAVGKLSNIALALKKDPGVAEKIKLVWLGTHYPDPGEYNLDSDTTPVNYVLDSKIEMEIVTVRWGKKTGTAAVTLSKSEALKMLPGLGPKNVGPITGRHGGTFTNLGDYLANLFEHIPYDQGSDSRALFDMAAVSVVKNPSWAQNITIPAPRLVNGKWVERPGNTRMIKVWENFNRDAIIGDFFNSLHYQQPH
ncbi:nucleoside hydrolase [Chryseolinea sp. T2]|uniref:nucleoside hydrolase n=1 Tax=Chryseolinea sp. T2 TaxID=3129255 RepID=UPI003076FF59